MTDITNIPIEWEQYQERTGYFVQTCPWCLYDVKQPYQSYLGFFNTFLPNPQAFLIKRIKIFGASSLQLDARFMLVIGNKIYQDTPLWIKSVRDSQPVIPHIMIPPLTMYRASIQDLPPFGTVGRIRPITIALLGEIVRPVQ